MDPVSALSDLFESAKSEDLGKVEVGDNRGDFVDMLNNAAGVSTGSPWCASWAMYRIRKTAALWEVRIGAMLSPSVVNMIHLNKTKMHQEPKKGDLCLMQMGTSGDGHTGIVGDVNQDLSHACIEGNTSSNDPNERNGGMVAIHTRKPGGMYGRLIVRGYVTPLAI